MARMKGNDPVSNELVAAAMVNVHSEIGNLLAEAVETARFHALVGAVTGDAHHKQMQAWYAAQTDAYYAAASAVRMEKDVAYEYAEAGREKGERRAAEAYPGVAMAFAIAGMEVRS